MTLRHCLLCLALLCPTAFAVQNTAGSQVALVSLYGFDLGVQHHDRLSCFRLSEAMTWGACAEDPPLVLPQDIRLVVGNMRRIGVMAGSQVKFYDEGGAFMDSCTIVLPPDWPLSQTIIGGGYFTECDVSRIGGGSLTVLSRQDGQTAVPMDCPVPAEARIFHFGVKSKLAFVLPDRVEIRQVYRKEDRSLACLPAKESDYLADGPADEMLVPFSDEIIAVRVGRAVRFVAFDKASGRWRAAIGADRRKRGASANKPLPTFEIPDLLN